MLLIDYNYNNLTAANVVDWMIYIPQNYKMKDHPSSIHVPNTKEAKRNEIEISKNKLDRNSFVVGTHE